MKYKAILTTTFLALATPALALNDDTITNNSGVAFNGSNSGTITNAGAGSFSPSATGGSARSSSDASSFSSANQAQGQTQNASSGVSGSGNSSVSIRDRKQAPAVFAPGLTNGYDCNGSASFGGSVAGFGIGGGSTVVSEACENVFLFRVLKAEGDTEAAWGVLCETDKVRKHSKKCDAYRGVDHYETKESEYPTGGSANDQRYR